MTIYPFEPGSEHRRILPYDLVYPEVFREVQEYVHSELPGIELVRRSGSRRLAGLH